MAELGISLSMWATYLASAATLYYVSLIVYRVYFSPLSKFPGPKLAAASTWYEFYYDVVQEGLFFKKIIQLHEQYGPVVRITPRELHIADSQFFEKFYTSKLDKDPYFYDMINVPQSTFGTKEHEIHRIRRAALNPYFSRSNIDAQVPLVQEMALQLCKQLEASGASGKPVRLDISFESLTIDVVTKCSFGTSYGTIENQQLAMQTNETFALAEKSNHINRTFPLVRKFLNAVPGSMLLFLIPRLRGVVNFQVNVRKNVQEILKHKNQYADLKSGKKAKPTVFHQLLTSDLPANELTEQRLTEDGTVLVFAGFSTTARALTVTAFHLINQPTILATLRAELAPLIARSAPGLPTYSELEPMPFFTAVIKEGIRLSWGTSSRLPRINRSPMEYRDHVIPPGTAISMNNQDVLMDPSIFIEPEKFKPERWIADDGKNRALDKYFVAFSKGNRSCVGLWLAYSEMYIGIAALFSRLDFELFETDERNIAPERDFFTPHANTGFDGVKVLVKPISS